MCKDEEMHPLCRRPPGKLVTKKVVVYFANRLRPLLAVVSITKHLVKTIIGLLV